MIESLQNAFLELGWLGVIVVVLMVVVIIAMALVGLALVSFRRVLADDERYVTKVPNWSP